MGAAKILAGDGNLIFGRQIIPVEADGMDPEVIVSPKGLVKF